MLKSEDTTGVSFNGRNKNKRENPKRSQGAEIPKSKSMEREETLDDDFGTFPPTKPMLLQTPWTLWFDVGWENTKRVYTVFDVQTFWRVMNNFPAPTGLPVRSNVHFFQREILPVWESPENIDGGKLMINFRDKRSILDKVWIEALMGLIGGTMDPSDIVVGVGINLRPGGDRFSFWTKTTSRPEIEEFCQRAKKTIGLDEIPIEFKKHREALSCKSFFEASSSFTL